MIELRPEPLAEVRPPVPKYLQEGYFVRFTDKWPSTMGHVAGRFFQIDKTNQVPYVRRYILPAGDFRDVDLSNGSGVFQESLYPINNSSLFEISFGWKLGSYLIHVYVPADRHINSLEFAGMTPDVTNVNRRFLGARKPEDSPFNDHRFFIYAVKDLEPVILRHYVLPNLGFVAPATAAFEKCIMGIFVNKCHLVEKKSPTDEQLKKAKVLEYHESIRW